ncbi:flagellar basal body rod protein FlgB [Rhodocyclus tenuis]|uniref:Flagellar basal body rod protein FlgB n=2 Tax=Rhodocyclus TaxID=1064 RepID=A0A6L5JWJ1_RHOTE|nr:flagellar basal body rod protein FlgB [Rhodocyclus gracilis]MQY51609.1 flagellar basal body rod protein FlgB [Rhodocyclus gracilis]MRD73091.1 flagellar basal body rod protein FlgB [Rhodocyclus gracilis]NJA89131.1 flagellar basal body rod protein FlgB [Rhodocyclus gracilis]
MTSKLDQAFSFQQKALDLRAYRQQVLAANIANADTPQFKARDFDFGSALKDAIAGRQGQPLSLTLTSDRHIPASGNAEPVSLMYRKETQSSVDGNTVDMDVERGKFSENSTYYEAGLTFITGRVKSMISAIQGQ